MLRFDQVLDCVEGEVNASLHATNDKVVVVRDVTGAITVVIPDAISETNLPAAEVERIARSLHDALGPYSPGKDQVVLRESDLVDPDDILKSPDRIALPDRPRIHLVDRLLTNQDWLREPVVSKPRIPTATAFSIKGGVGRSTAFALWAWYLAQAGKNVWVLDLDLEAPGIASLLLPPNDFPEHGLVDWFVEALVGQADATLLEMMLASSPLAEKTPGTIRVVPALGRSSYDYVAKLGRVYMPQLTKKGTMEGFAHRLSTFIDFAKEKQEDAPDIIMLDARAGLHDIGSAAVTQLGAEVFLFARDDQPTWDAYTRLFEHLRMARSVKWGMPENDLRWRLKMVAAQLDPSEGALDRWLGQSYSCWSEFYDDEPEEVPREGCAQTFERNEKNAPHAPLPILFDMNVRRMNLIHPSERPAWPFVEATFGQFFRDATARLFETPNEGHVERNDP